MAWRWMIRLLVIAHGVVGCAAIERERPDSLHGTSGTVSWDVVGIRTVIAPDGRSIEWSYTLILRNTGGPEIRFEALETSAQSSAGVRFELLAGVHREPFEQRLAAPDELRVNSSYRLTYTVGSTSGFGESPGGSEGLMMLYRFLGKDSGGRPVTVAVRFPLHPGAGHRVTAGPAPAALPSTSPASTPEANVPEARSPAGPRASESGTRPSSPRAGGGPKLLLEAARECQHRFPKIEALAIGADGQVTFRSEDPGEHEAFEACSKQLATLKMSGRRVPSPAAADRVSVVLETDGRSLVVRAVLEQDQPARLIVDTGATKTMLRPDMLERLGISVGPDALRVEIVTVSGERIPDVPLARLGSLTVGAVTVENLYVAVYDLIPQMPEVDGLLGLDFLGHFQVRLDRDSRSLTLEARP